MMGWAIIGTGRFADAVMAPAIAAAGGSLIGVCGRDPSKAAAFAQKHRAEGHFTDVAALLERAGIDAVYVSSPNALHAEHVRAAARAGKHVLCDKPLAMTVAEAASIIDECKKASVVLATNFQGRQFSAYHTARDVLASGALGSLRLMQMSLGLGYRPLAGWRANSHAAGLGVIFNVAIHGYDAIRFITGREVVSVSAKTLIEEKSALENLAVAMFELDCGALVDVVADQLLPFPCNDLQICGSRGRIIGTNVTRVGLSGSLSVQIDGQAATASQHETSDCFKRTIEDFHYAIRGRSEPAATGYDGLKSVELAIAVAQSAATGQTIRLPLATVA